MDTQRFFIAIVDAVRYGPVPMKELVRWFEEGRIGPDTHVEDHAFGVRWPFRDAVNMDQTVRRPAASSGWPLSDQRGWPASGKGDAGKHGPEVVFESKEGRRLRCIAADSIVAGRSPAAEPGAFEWTLGTYTNETERDEQDSGTISRTSFRIRRAGSRLMVWNVGRSRFCAGTVPVPAELGIVLTCGNIVEVGIGEHVGKRSVPALRLFLTALASWGPSELPDGSFSPGGCLVSRSDGLSHERLLWVRSSVSVAETPLGSDTDERWLESVDGVLHMADIDRRILLPLSQFDGFQTQTHEWKRLG